MFTSEGVCTLQPPWAAAAAERVTLFAEDMLNGSYEDASDHFKFMVNAAGTLGCAVLCRADLPDSFGQCESTVVPGKEDAPGKMWFTCGHFTAGAIPKHKKHGWPNMLRHDHAHMATPADSKCAQYVADANDHLGTTAGRKSDAGVACYLSADKVSQLTRMFDPKANDWAFPMTSDDQLVTLITMLRQATLGAQETDERFMMANTSPFGSGGSHWFPLHMRLTAEGADKKARHGLDVLRKFNVGRIGKGTDSRMRAERPTGPSDADRKRATAFAKRRSTLMRLVEACGKPASEMTRVDLWRKKTNAKGTRTGAIPPFPKKTTQKTAKPKRKRKSTSKK